MILTAIHQGLVAARLPSSQCCIFLLVASSSCIQKIIIIRKKDSELPTKINIFNNFKPNNAIQRSWSKRLLRRKDQKQQDSGRQTITSDVGFKFLKIVFESFKRVRRGAREETITIELMLILSNFKFLVLNLNLWSRCQNGYRIKIITIQIFIEKSTEMLHYSSEKLIDVKMPGQILLQILHWCLSRVSRHISEAQDEEENKNGYQKWQNALPKMLLQKRKSYYKNYHAPK